MFVILWPGRRERSCCGIRRYRRLQEYATAQRHVVMLQRRLIGYQTADVMTGVKRTVASLKLAEDKLEAITIKLEPGDLVELRD